MEVFALASETETPMIYPEEAVGAGGVHFILGNDLRPLLLVAVFENASEARQQVRLFGGVPVVWQAWLSANPNPQQQARLFKGALGPLRLATINNVLAMYGTTPAPTTRRIEAALAKLR